MTTVDPWMSGINKSATCVTTLMEALNRPLNETRRASEHVGETTETHIFLAGYYGRHPKCARICFQHGATETDAEPRIEELNHMMLYGSKKVWDSLYKDARFSQYARPVRNSIFTLSSAIERAHNDIRAQCDPEALKIDEDTCWAIGGRPHIATVTYADGFGWVAGFEPPE
jgi:hypothetical protein